MDEPEEDVIALGAVGANCVDRIITYYETQTIILLRILQEERRQRDRLARELEERDRGDKKESG